MRFWILSTALLALLCVGPWRPVSAEEPVQRFLEGLRSRGWHDTAEDYLETLRNNPAIPAETKALIPYEQGQTIVASSRAMRDIKLRLKALDSARVKYEEFLNQNSSHKLVGMARLQLGNVLLERGAAFVEMAKKPSADKAGILAQSQAEFKKAMKVFEDAVTEFETKWKAFPKFIPEEDEKLRAQRVVALSDLIQAQLYAATAVYEYSKSFDEKDEQRTAALKEAAGKFKLLFEKWRTRLAGLYAGMWEARCYQDIGDQESMRRALGIYDELLAQPDDPEPFRILKAKVLRLAMEAWCDPIQKKYEAAIQKGDEWLKKARADQERAPEGLAIRYFTAVALHQQVLEEKAKKKSDAEVVRRLSGRIPKLAKFISDSPGEYQKAAKDLLSKYRDVSGEPETFVEARDAGKIQLDSAQVLQFNLKQEEAKGKAKDPKAIAKLKADIAHANEEAIRLLRLAIVMRDDETSIDDINVVRYFLAYLYYTNGRYLDAAVMGEFLAVNYPNSTGARHGAKIAMAGYLQAYNSVRSDEKEFETRQMVRVASYVAKQWPDEPDADEAWMILGDLAIREKDLEKAAEYLNHIPKSSPRRADADLKAGQALWGTYLNSQVKDPKPPAEVSDKLLAQAEAKLKDGVATMRKQLGPKNPLSYNLLAAELSLAQLYVNTGRGEDAIKVLNGENGPLKLLAKKDPVTQTKENFPRETFKAALRAYVAVQDMDNAEKMMKAMEALVQGHPDAQKSLTQIYISLGREVEQQVETTTDPAKLNKLLSGFELFLGRIANSKNATFNSLSWVAVTFYNLGSGLDKPGRAASTNAKKYYESAAKTYEQLLKHPDLKPEMKPGLEVRLSKCKRRTGDYNGAVNMLLKLLATNNKALEAQREACYTFQEWAAAAKKPRYYNFAMAGYRDSKTGKQLVWGWNGLANRVQSNANYRDTMHEARYNMLECRFKQAMEGKQGKDRTDALKRAITSVNFTYRSFPNMGGQEWWDKYDQLLKNVQRALDPNKPALGLKAFKEDAGAKTAAKG